MVTSRCGRQKLLVALGLASLGWATPAAAQTPILLDITFTPQIVSAGASTQMDVQVDNAVAIEAVFLNQPNGVSGSLPISPFVGAGNIFSATVTVPAGTLNGLWQIQELGVEGTDGAIYRFIDSGAGFGLTPCPTFQNIGVFACDSDVVRDFGSFEVQGGVNPPAAPTLTGITMSPPGANPGDILTATIDTLDATEVESLFVTRPAGTNGSLPFGPFQQTGTTFSADAPLPLNSASGT